MMFDQKLFTYDWKKPGVVNRTKPNQNSIKPNDFCSIGSVIEHNLTGTFL